MIANLQDGSVQVNHAQVASPNFSYRQSGLGREPTRESIFEHFTVRKSVAINFE
jgi:hypothetical protein